MIEEKGLSYHARTLESEEFLKAIKAKMIEEATEFHAAENSQESVEELADLLELIHTALSEFDVSFKELEATREHKKKFVVDLKKEFFY